MKWSPISKYGQLMTIDEFIDACYTLCLTDYDGYDYYSDGDRMSDVVVVPSMYYNGLDHQYTHIAWFNR
jgi:hypothetical protein